MDLRRLDDTDGGSETRRALLPAAVFAVIAGLAAVDLLVDLGEGTSLRHALVEGLVVVAAIVGLAVLLRRLVALRSQEREARAAAAALGRELERVQADGARWRAQARELVAGLGALIDEQLARWQLSPAEAEVALLLLKGLSHKEVAAARRVTDATARQQAAAVYRKAGVSGRHDLAAFFLEDLLAPRPRG